MKQPKERRALPQVHVSTVQRSLDTPPHSGVSIYTGLRVGRRKREHLLMKPEGSLTSALKHGWLLNMFHTLDYNGLPFSESRRRCQLYRACTIIQSTRRSHHKQCCEVAISAAESTRWLRNMAGRCLDSSSRGATLQGVLSR